MFIDKISIPLRALLVALGGVFLAWLWYSNRIWLAVLLATLASLFSFTTYWMGRQLLPRRPRLAMVLMTGWAITEAVLATLAAAAVIIITVSLTVPATTPTATKELISSLSTGVTAFITAVFIAWAGDDKDTSTGDRIASDFQKSYQRALPAGQQRDPKVHYFAPDSIGERLVYGEDVEGISGWRASARWKRAAKLAEQLKTHASDG